MYAECGDVTASYVCSLHLLYVHRIPGHRICWHHLFIRLKYIYLSFRDSSLRDHQLDSSTRNFCLFVAFVYLCLFMVIVVMFY